MLDGRAFGAVIQRLVDPCGVEREAFPNAAVVDGDAGVLADEVRPLLGHLDVLEDRVQDALAGRMRLAAGCVGERVAEVLRDVLQRPDIQVRCCVLDDLLEIRGDHAALAAAVRPARRPNTVHSSRELPIILFRPCVPPAISPQAKRPGTVVSPCSSMTRPPFW